MPGRVPQPVQYPDGSPREQMRLLQAMEADHYRELRELGVVGLLLQRRLITPDRVEVADAADRHGRLGTEVHPPLHVVRFGCADAGDVFGLSWNQPPEFAAAVWQNRHPIPDSLPVAIQAPEGRQMRPLEAAEGLFGQLATRRLASMACRKVAGKTSDLPDLDPSLSIIAPWLLPTRRASLPRQLRPR